MSVLISHSDVSEFSRFAVRAVPGVVVMHGTFQLDLDQRIDYERVTATGLVPPRSGWPRVNRRPSQGSVP